MQGTERADWQEVLSDGTDPPAQAGTREEWGIKKVNMLATNEIRSLKPVLLNGSSIGEPSLNFVS